MNSGRETTKLVKVHKVAKLPYGGSGSEMGKKLKFNKDDTVVDLDISFPDEKSEKNDQIRDE